MMKCPRCKAVKGITAVSYIGAFDVVSYQFNCPACGVMWKRSWGMRLRGGSEKRRKDMENVTVLPNRLQQMTEERIKGQ